MFGLGKFLREPTRELEKPEKGEQWKESPKTLDELRATILVMNVRALQPVYLFF